MTCGCSVSKNKPTRQIGIPQQRSRSHSSPNALCASAAERAPSISQSATAFELFISAVSPEDGLKYDVRLQVCYIAQPVDRGNAQ